MESQELERYRMAFSHFVLEISSPAASFSDCSSGYSNRWGIILKSGGEAGAEQTPPKYVLHKTRAWKGERAERRKMDLYTLLKTIVTMKRDDRKDA